MIEKKEVGMDNPPRYLDVYSKPEELAFKLSRLFSVLNLYYLLYGLTRTRNQDIEKFRNIHKNERCFIMGGGPSLKLIDPEPLKNEITFGMNGIFLIYDWLGFEPNYYVVEDFLVYQDRWKDILSTVNNSTCFFPVQFLRDEFDRSSHHYMRAIYEFDSKAGFPRFSTDLSRLVWIGGTVTYVCMQLAYYMGFREVYLLGMDHSYLRPEHVQSEGDIWKSCGEDPNHFHPDYFGAGYRWHDPKVWRMEMAYVKAKEVFEASDRKIFNATVGGKLEVFERVDYREIFN